LLDHGGDPVDAVQAAADVLPLGEETGELAGLDGLDLLTQGGERATADAPEDPRVAPFEPRSARQELALFVAGLLD